MIKKKWLCVVYIVLGVIIAVSNAILFVGFDHTIWQAIMLLVGIGFVFIGVSNLRRLQQTSE